MMKHKLIALVAGAFLALAATVASAGWEDNATVFGKLFGKDSTAVIVAYFEDGSFYLEDDAGNTYKGCQLGMPCDDTIGSALYLAAVSK